MFHTNWQDQILWDIPNIAYNYRKPTVLYYRGYDIQVHVITC
jgi:hypothetical protein